MYTSFFGLKETPFNLTPDPRYLYLSASHREALAQLVYGIREKKGFIVVTGEVGTGKTTLLHTLLEHLDPEIKVAFVFYPRLDFRDLLRLILEDFGCQTVAATTSQYLLQLNQFLIERRSNGDTTVLIIDEAQHLSPTLLEDLRMLSNLEAAGEKLLQIVLVGQPELQEALQLPHLRQLRQRISLICELQPLRTVDTCSYIHHRFAVAGGEARTVFTPRALKTIHACTGGLPRQIHTVCDNALLAAYAEGARSVTPRIVRQVIRDMRPIGGRRTLGKRRGMIVVLFVCVVLLLGSVLFDAQAYNSYFPSLSQMKSSLQRLYQKLKPQESVLGSGQGASGQALEENHRPLIRPSIPLATSDVRAVLDDHTQGHTGFLHARPREDVRLLARTRDQQASPLVVPAQEAKPDRQDQYPTVRMTEKGDSLWKQAVDVYGYADNEMIQWIQENNTHIVDINTIEVGDQILFPALEITKE